MAELDFEKLLSGEGVTQDAVPEGTYTFKVLDARSHEGKGNGTVFLDLEVVDGPLAGSLTQVSLFIPDGTGNNPRGAAFHFAKKVAGFKLGPELGRAMNGGKPAPILAEALVDQVVEGEVDVQGDGAYAGSNNLLSTKPVDGDTPEPAAKPAPKAKPKVAEEPAEATEDTSEGDDDALPF